MSILTPADLATFKQTEDGNLEVKIEKFGRLTIILPNGQTMEVYIARDPKKQFGCFVTTDTIEDPKTKAKLVKANGGQPPSVTHRLQVDGSLAPEEKPAGREERSAATGSEASLADFRGPGPAVGAVDPVSTPVEASGESSVEEQPQI